MNPYWNADFFDFFLLFFTRLFRGDFSSFVADEVQVGVLSLVAISCGWIGPFLVLRRMTMFANALSHTILLGLSLSYLLLGGTLLLSHLLMGALIAALITALFTEGLVKVFHLQEDASIGLVFTSLFALGVMLVTLFTRDLHLGIEAVMGNADALQSSDFRFASWLILLNGSVLSFFYSQFQVASFDSHFARTVGISPTLFRFLLLFLAAITCVGAFRAVGAILVLAFLVGPYLTVRLFCHRLKPLLFFSSLLGAFTSFLGVALARHMLTVYGIPLSTGGIVVSLIALFYLIALAAKRISYFRTLNSSHEGKNLVS